MNVIAFTDYFVQKIKVTLNEWLKDYFNDYLWKKTLNKNDIKNIK